MPFVDLHSTDDYATIFYRTNTSNGNVGGFDAGLPSLILLHPLLLDSSWLDQQFGDPRLSSNYNMIAFDMRSAGRSSCRSSGRHDSWVDAADLAHCHQTLHLPPCHILALGVTAVCCALRFAFLFPEMCLSLALCNVSAPTELKWIFAAYDELLQEWSLSKDLESFEYAMKDCVGLVAGSDCEPELRDELIDYWATQMPPSQITKVAESLAVSMNRMLLPPGVLGSITQPVLLVHGEKNDICPKKYAEKLVSQLTNVEDGPVLYTVKGGSNSLSIVPAHASIANQVFAKFLGRLPLSRSDLVPPEMPRAERMKIALTCLAETMADADMAFRDPLSSLSFSCLPPETIQRQTEALYNYKKEIATCRSFAICGPDEHSLLRYCGRASTQWSYGEWDGRSITGQEPLLIPFFSEILVTGSKVEVQVA